MTRSDGSGVGLSTQPIRHEVPDRIADLLRGPKGVPSAPVAVRPNGHELAVQMPVFLHLRNCTLRVAL